MLNLFRDRLNRVPRRIKSLILVLFDAGARVIVLWLSYQMRLGGSFEPTAAQWVIMLVAPAVALPIFLRLGLYRAVIRYLPERAIWTIVWAMMLATLAWVFVLFIAEVSRFAVLPRTVPVIYFLLGVIVVAGSRFAAKYLLYPVEKGPPARPVLVYGAGDSGRQLAATLAGLGDSFVIGFLDDDKNLHGRDVSGLRGYPPSKLPDLIVDLGIKEVVLSMASLESTRRQAIYSELSQYPVKVRTLPSLREIASGKYQVNQLREIDIDDLLGRSSVPADPDLLQRMIKGRSILLSGGGGSIGSELCRIVARLQPARLVILEANEFALYQIERQLAHDRALQVVPVLGSVADDALVRRPLGEYEIDVVFHAAAHKHVPLLEANVLEGVRNNIFGTLTLVRAAFDAGVRDVILISSDKAVRPTNIMGATKRWAELIIRLFADRADGSGRHFSAVRFGNVLGSNGSVVPLFREQIAAGDQVRIRDLAENMIRLAGLSVRSAEHPYGDIAIAVSGIRPGEKLYEELFYDETQAIRTPQPKILKAKMVRRSNEDFEASLAALKAALDAEDEAEVRRILFEVITPAQAPSVASSGAPAPL